MGLIENRSHTLEMPTANRTAVQITLQQITDGLTSPKVTICDQHFGAMTCATKRGQNFGMQQLSFEHV